MQLPDLRQGAGGGPAPGLRARQRAPPDFARPVRVAQQPVHRARQFRSVLDPDRGAGGPKLVVDRLEVLHVRAGDHGLGEQRRLQRVVSAPPGQGASHEDDVRGREQAAQLADRIQQQHERARRGAPVERGPPQVRNARRFQLPRRRIEALRLSRHQDQEQVAVPLRQVRVRRQHSVILVQVARVRRRHRAGGDPHRPGPGSRNQLGHGRSRGSRARLEIVLEISRGAGPFGRRAQGQKPLADRFGLRQDRIRVRQDRREEAAERQIARKGAVGDPAVHNGQRRSGSLRFAKQVRPDLGLRHDDHGRLERSQHAAHRKHIVRRSIEDAVRQAAQFLIRRGAPRQRRGGNEKPARGKFRSQPAQQLQAGKHFAHRNCVQPDGARAGLS